MTANTSKHLRIETIKALAIQALKWGDDVHEYDYALDNFYREIAKLPPRPQSDLPLKGFFPSSTKPEPLFNSKTIAEYQLRPPTYQYITSPVLGKIVVTGGFMESQGHAYKSYKQAIFANGKKLDLRPANRNLGIDYCCSEIKAWYDGQCTKVAYEKGYGNRAYFVWDVSYEHEGDKYAVHGAFAHAASFTVKTGDKVTQGQLVGYQGSTGGNYAPHIDYRQWIEVDGKTVDLSPNALESQLHG